MQNRNRRRGFLALCLTLGLACGPPPETRATDPDSVAPDTTETVEARREAARSCFSRGVFAREAGNPEEALRQFTAAVHLTPEDPAVRLTYAEFLLELGRPDDARRFLGEAVRRFGGTGLEHLLLARLQVLDGDLRAARAEVDSSLAHDPRLADAWRLRGRLSLDGGDAGDAYTCFQRADSLQPYDPGTLEGMAAAARSLGRLEEARQLLERVLQLDPASQSARRTLSGVYNEEGRSDDARRLALEGLEVDPDDPDRIETALEALLDAGDAPGAARMLRPYHERGTLGPRLEYLYARVLMHLDRLAAADSVLQQLTTVEGLVGIETLRGEIAAREGRTGEARAHYRKAIAERPDDCVPHASLALLLAEESAASRRKGGPPATAAVDSALAAAQRLTGAESFRCNVLLGLAGMAVERYDLSEGHFAAAVKLDPDNREVLLDLAMARQEAGHSDAALEAAREVLRLDPEHATALNFVGYVLAERGEQLPESERLIRKALAQEPANGYFVDSLGWVLYQKGEYKEAVVELRRAVELTEGKDALILEHLGDACAKLGTLEEARDSYERARTLDPNRRVLSSKLAETEARLRHR